ncbi:MAG: hypothetical protein LQ338_001205 [Usnochroma carphineum]|nr:MAG: hypothetical protein LQ338_001205 [Usnochroma carphineum]
MAHQKDFSKILELYARLPTRRVDLVGDYAGQELFIVEGDGLLLRCFDDPDLDFHEGFQLLHAVYAVEHFLQGLLQRKCVFDIVFFDAHKNLCIPRATPSVRRNKYLLARAIIIRHLTVHLQTSHPHLKVLTFASALDEAFQQYLVASGAYFVMTHDGANLVDLEHDRSAIDRSPDLDFTAVEREELQRRASFRSTIFTFLDHGYNVALIDGLEWMDTKIMTVVVEGPRRSKASSNIVDTVLRSQPSIQSKSASTHLADIDDLQKDVELIAQSTAGEDAVTERMLLTLATLCVILKGKLGKQRVVLATLIHLLLITERPLSNRHIGPATIDVQKRHETEDFIGTFAEIATALLHEAFWNNLCSKASLDSDIADLIDGRLFVAVWRELADDGSTSAAFSPLLLARLQKVTDTLSASTGTQIRLITKSEQAQSRSLAQTTRTSSTNKGATILPFSDTVFEKHMRSIRISVQSSQEPSSRSNKVFRELSHWHNAKRRLDPKASHAISDRDKARALRRNQFFMAEMAGYAASLTGVTGKILEPDLITVSEVEKPGKDSIGRTKETIDPLKQRKGQTSKAPSNAKAIIAANVAAKGGGIADKAIAAWKTVRANLDAERQLQSRYRKTRIYLRDLSDEKRNVVEAEVQYYILATLLKMYRILCKQSEMDAQHQIDGVTALMFSTVRELTAARGMTKTIIDQVKSVVKALKLPDVEFASTSVDRKLSFDADLRLSDIKSIASSHAEFQLQHCGPYMDRNLDSAPDPRVKTFHPDGWQRKVLDELDADRSIFVVAPTSAGKTFISFYAMEKILRKNDDSVLVYVAPTKALVNQIGAEIQARFKKSYRHAGRSVWAIHTRDYRINNPSGCQILVTVPHILQIMLLSPSNAKSWCQKVKCIIFDEIHCIGQAEDGVVWEQLLLMAPCPIIALSATVGNPEQFNAWLTSTQQSSGFELTMITHQHRFSDLRKFVYKPPKTFTFNGLPEPAFATLGLDGLNGLAFVHPVASLVNKSRGMPQDLSLEARDCFLLWKSMVRHQTKEFPVDEKLSPDRLPQVIRKAHIIGWEQQLKALLRLWMVEDQSPFDKVVEDLNMPMHESDRPSRYMSRAEDASVKIEDTNIDADDLYQTTLPLLCKLQERDALPAILFNYDRSKCEGICKTIVKQLKDAEAAFKESSPAWKAKIRGYEQYLKNKSKLNPKKAAPAKKGKANQDEGTSKADRMQEAASEEADPYANFSPDAAVTGFHFANIAKAEAAELAAIQKELNRRGLQPWLMESLMRGIGVHHAGMNRKYRQAVEMLFRKGFLRVVIATGTLALGINMPCATVVFSGDSVFLTALNFRQAAGRAGRRGFDLLGNVVFQNIQTAKVCRLLSSRLPDLTGHFPVTTTLILRLFTLLHESGHAKYAVDAVNSLLSQPRLYLDGPAFKDQVLHHLRFSIEYLRRHDLLSAEGVPLNFAGLTSHLYYTENSSFALNALLKEGYFHELCSDIDTSESRVIRTLMIVMAHLFGRHPCKHSDKEFIEETVKRSPSVVFLPSLPDSASRILQHHNDQTLQIFSTYVQTFVDQHVREPDNRLPLTGLSVGGNHDHDQTFQSFPSSLDEPPPRIRSPFVALSGHTDTFTSIPSLCRTVRSGVFLEESVIPHLPLQPHDTLTPLNAYLYDFYMHGDITALENANGVRKSDVWFLLNDFSLVLATILTSLGNYMRIPDGETDMEDLVGGGDEANNKDDEAFAAVDSGYGSAASSVADLATSVSSASLNGTKGKKKKVEESWETEADKDAVAEEEDAAWDEEEEDGELQQQTRGEVEKGFVDIYKAFSKLKREFDEKFRAIFA